MYHKRITMSLGIVADSSDGKSAKALGGKWYQGLVWGPYKITWTVA